tara:strand:- start:349 stop:1011 length:663 start_codon:yes stop_codon:yes gene_type:complete
MNTDDEETHTPAEFYGAFANAVYSETDEGKLEALAEQDITGWEIDPTVNNEDRTAFRRRNKNDDGYDVILASRGTSKTRNLLPDLAIMFGAEGKTKRYRELSQDYNKLKSTLGSNDKLVSTGHSLAGNQSVFLNRKYGVESHAFNAGASISHMKQGFIHNIACWANPNWSVCKNADKSHIYHTPGDPLSTASIFDRDNKHYHKRRSGQSPHTINNFLKNV